MCSARALVCSGLFLLCPVSLLFRSRLRRLLVYSLLTLDSARMWLTCVVLADLESADALRLQAAVPGTHSELPSLLARDAVLSRSVRAPKCPLPRGSLPLVLLVLQMLLLLVAFSLPRVAKLGPS